MRRLTARRIEEPSASVAGQVRSELLRAIISLELRPGERISEVDIAERCGVSRQPVREAVIALGQTGLVKTLPQRGTTVVPISIATLMDSRFVREAIEVAVARQAAHGLPQHARRHLDQIIEQQRRAVEDGDRDAFFRHDEAFHCALCQGIGSDQAWPSIKNVKVHMDRACTLTLKDAAGMRPLIDEHCAILAAIDKADPDAAALAMSAHLSGIIKSLPEIEASHPDYFE